MDKPQQQTTKTEWTVAELAERAGVSGQYIRRQLAEKKLRGRKIGHQWVIRDSDARRWLEQRR